MTATTDMRDAYLSAELDLLQHGKSSAFEGRVLTMSDLSEIRAGRLEWERRAHGEAAAGSPFRAAIATFSDAR